MQNLKVEVQLSRVTSNMRDQYWELRISDEASHLRMITVELNNDQLAELIGSSRVPADAQVISGKGFRVLGLERVAIALPLGFVHGYTESYLNDLGKRMAKNFEAESVEMRKTNGGMSMILIFYVPSADEFEGELIKDQLRHLVAEDMALNQRARGIRS